jgi:hypothetical protein
MTVHRISSSARLAVPERCCLILQREPIHSALSLIVVMVSLAVLYLLLGAEFIAAVQIIVYAGAIMVLFVFVIMLLNAGVEERTERTQAAALRGVPLGFLSAAPDWRWRMGLRRSARRRNGLGESARTGAYRRAIFPCCFFSNIVFRLS